ncbi:MAG TPA: ABC transporter permease subunit [Verrucomicrobiae bacterium]|nr:ABC transporter permease subunit [Verrucomicrobiae bacterium]
MNNIRAVAGVVVKEMYRRKDFYVLLVLTVVITALMGSVHFFHDDKIVRYLKEICLLLIWISSLFIAIATIARQVPAEIESRTIFPLLAKPITRTQLLIGKFFGCWLACGLALVCFYLFFGLICASREQHWHLLNWVQAATLHWAMLAILIALTLLGSLVFTAPSSNATICFILAAGALMVGRHLNKVALRMSQPGQSVLYAIYFAMPHLDIFDVRELIIHNWPPIAWRYYAIAIAYALIYAALFLAGACLLFRRKALN